MNTTEAIPTPGAVQDDGYYTFRVKRELYRLPVGTIFEDGYHKQLFEKVAEIINRRGEPRHVLQCVAGPFETGQKLGPVCGAFFCRVGDLVYREGKLKVFVRAEPREDHEDC